jgi:hypothetical protein
VQAFSTEHCVLQQIILLLLICRISVVGKLQHHIISPANTVTVSGRTPPARMTALKNWPEKILQTCMLIEKPSKIRRSQQKTSRSIDVKCWRQNT